jgi:hypothetical protein
MTFDNTPGSPDGPPADPIPVVFQPKAYSTEAAESDGGLAGTIAAWVFAILFGTLLGSAILWAIVFIWMHMPGRGC